MTTTLLFYLVYKLMIVYESSWAQRLSRESDLTVDFRTLNYLFCITTYYIEYGIVRHWMIIVLC